VVCSLASEDLTAWLLLGVFMTCRGSRGSGSYNSVRANTLLEAIDVDLLKLRMSDIVDE